MNTALINIFFYNSTIIQEKYKNHGSVGYVVASGSVKYSPIYGAEKNHFEMMITNLIEI